MTYSIDKFKSIIRDVDEVLRRGTALVDREDKIAAVILLISDQFPGNPADLEVALRHVVAISSDLSPDRSGSSGKSGRLRGSMPYKAKFREFLAEKKGLGFGSVLSYISYLNGASKDLRENVPHALLDWNGEPDDIVESFADQMLKMDCHYGTIRNRKSAMRAYLEMVHEYHLSNDEMPESNPNQGCNVEATHTTGEKYMNHYNDIDTIVPMIEDKESYVDFLENEGVGDNDIAADSRASYVSYLNSVSSALGRALTRELILAEGVDKILDRVRNVRRQRTGRPPSDNTLNRWRTALNRYEEFAGI